MKLLNLPLSLALMTFLSLSTACNSAKFTGKSGVSTDVPTSSAPVETPTGTETPGIPPMAGAPGSETPSTQNPTNPGTPGTPGTPNVPATPGTPGNPTIPGNPGNPGGPGTIDPDCASKGSCSLPCDPSKTQCIPAPQDECTTYGINCPGQDDDDPTQNDDPSQN